MGKLAYRRSLGITGAMLILASLFLVAAGPALAVDGDLVEGNCNEAGGWTQNVTSGPWGTITNNGDGSVSVNLNPGWSLELCVKGGPDYMVYQVSTSGVSGPYWPPANCGENANQCGLSHWAIREVDFETTTTSEDETTTSEGETTTSEDSTTTTEDETTTTSEDETTTTTEDETTTTTEDETTTTTAQQVTTTRVDQTTASTAGTTASTVGTTAGTTATSTEVTVSVGGIQVSAPAVAQVTQATLPFTGLSTTSIATLAAGLAAIGLLVLAAARRVDEEAPVRRW